MSKQSIQIRLLRFGCCSKVSPVMLCPTSTKLFKLTIGYSSPNAVSFIHSSVKQVMDALLMLRALSCLGPMPPTKRACVRYDNWMYTSTNFGNALGCSASSSFRSAKLKTNNLRLCRLCRPEDISAWKYTPERLISCRLFLLLCYTLFSELCQKLWEPKAGSCMHVNRLNCFKFTLERPSRYRCSLMT